MVSLYGHKRVGPALAVYELDLEGLGSKQFDHGPDLAPNQAMFRQVMDQRDHIE